MQSLARYMAPPSPCGYLPELSARLEYELILDMTAAEYGERMLAGWRRFGRAVFRPRCRSCQECKPIRVNTECFRPDRSQRRAWRANDDVLRLRIGEPRVTRHKLDLYDRYHAFQTDAKGWPAHPTKDPQSYISSFVDNPFPVEEWCYLDGSRLVGVGYVDVVPPGLSGIYFFYDPDYRARSLGTFNVLNLLHQAAGRGLPHVYLGYYVAACRSMQYKARFQPNEIRRPDGTWVDFLR
jgi:arginine-tRNA-protein transferase